MKKIIFILIFVLFSYNAYAQSYNCIDTDQCTSLKGRWVGYDYQCYQNADYNYETFEVIHSSMTVDLCGYAGDVVTWCVEFIAWQDGYLFDRVHNYDDFCYEIECDFAGQPWQTGITSDYFSTHNDPYTMRHNSYVEDDNGDWHTGLCEQTSYTVNLGTQSNSADDKRVAGEFPTFDPQQSEAGFIVASSWYLWDYFALKDPMTWTDNILLQAEVCYDPYNNHGCDGQGPASGVDDFMNEKLTYCEANYFNCNQMGFGFSMHGQDICSDPIAFLDLYFDNTKRPIYFRTQEHIVDGNADFYHTNHYVVLGRTGSNWLVQHGCLGRVQITESRLLELIINTRGYPEGVAFDCGEEDSTTAFISFDDGFDNYGTLFDGIAWEDDDPPLQFFIEDVPNTIKCLCYDYDSDGDSTTSAEYDECIYQDGYFDECSDFWPLFEEVCDTKPCAGITNVEFVSIILPSDEPTYDLIDATYYVLDGQDGKQYNVDAEWYFVIDQVRADCGDEPDYSVVGRFGQGFVDIETGVQCPLPLLDRSCDNDHDDELTACFTEGCTIGDPCKVNVGNDVSNQCFSSDDCLGDAICDGNSTSYETDCIVDGEDSFYLNRLQYDKTCGGAGFTYGMTYQWATVDCSAVVGSNTVCDEDHDDILQIAPYSLEQCKISVPNQFCTDTDDCWNDNWCNSYNRCGECYSTVIETNVDCPNNYYCVGPYGDACGGADPYTCACCQRLGEIDDCLDLEEGHACESDAECVEETYCSGDLITPGFCTFREDDGFPCDRDRICSNLEFGCNDENHCGQCWSTAIEFDPVCTDPDKPYCTDAGGIACNLQTNYVCDCCDQLGVEDCCLEFPKPELILPEEYYSYTSCFGYDCECEQFEYNATRNITCMDVDPGPDENLFCVDCVTDQDCTDKYPGNIFNHCDGAYCECNQDGVNPPGCDTDLCFGGYPGGYLCDCDEECFVGQCINFAGVNKCAYEPPVACMESSSTDDDHDDNFILNATQTLTMNLSCSTGWAYDNISFSCLYNGTSFLTGICQSLNSSYCTNCANTNYVNTAWDTPIDVTVNNGSDLYFVLVVGYGPSDITSQDDLIVNPCWRGGLEWCGETCFDFTQNQDETDIDYGGICGNCSDGILNGGETEIDYGGQCNSCTDGIQNGPRDGPGSENETAIDYGGWCGACFDGNTDVRIFELFDGYGGPFCGSCYNNVLDPQLNETSIDYGGSFCGYCINDSTPIEDFDWQFVKNIDGIIPFPSDRCPQATETVSFLLIFFMLIGILLVGIFIFFLIIFLIPIISAITTVSVTVARVFGTLKKTKVLNKAKNRITNIKNK